MRDVAALVHEHGHAAIAEMIRTLQVDADAIIALAAERASTIGVREYGDSAFRKTAWDLVEERYEELADGVFYAVAQIVVQGEIRKRE